LSESREKSSEPYVTEKIQKKAEPIELKPIVKTTIELEKL
jgi:hypothetical protein